MTDEPKRKVGRPRVPADKAKSRCITMRIREATWNRLCAESDGSGYSMSETIERRLERSYVSDDTFRAIREGVRQEIRAEFEARREPLNEMLATRHSAAQALSDLCGPAAYHRINGEKN